MRREEWRRWMRGGCTGSREKAKRKERASRGGGGKGGAVVGEDHDTCVLSLEGKMRQGRGERRVSDRVRENGRNGLPGKRGERGEDGPGRDEDMGCQEEKGREGKLGQV
jgi:hypothetical protein